VPWYPRVLHAINTLLLSVLLPTQSTNLALLVSALLAKRTLCLSELARAYPRPAPEQRASPFPSTTSCIASNASGGFSTIHALMRRPCNLRLFLRPSRLWDLLVCSASPSIGPS
jgi:hypothetical protein